jgi:hypothetical protein
VHLHAKRRKVAPEGVLAIRGQSVVGGGFFLRYDPDHARAWPDPPAIRHAARLSVAPMMGGAAYPK